MMREHSKGHPTSRADTSVVDDPAVSDQDIAMCVMLLEGRRVAVLTGAGISTESGIPDYRGPVTRKKLRNPMRGNTFRKSEAHRLRYWSRSFVGWPRMRDKEPNAGHVAIRDLQAAGMITSILTQNVDGLHEKAGSTNITCLHGELAQVRCLECQKLFHRDEVQRWLSEANAGGLSVNEPTVLAPDGDADIDVEHFHIVACPACGGVIKPDVVFFGENVPRHVVDDGYRAIDEASALLIIGTSLEVYSARRYVLRAVEQDFPIIIINLGPTRMDDVATLQIHGRAGDVLSRIAESFRTSEARPLHHLADSPSAD